jgi:phosphatidylserine decarboxylase
MAKPLEQWIETDVREVKTRSLAWLSSSYFFRDPPRPTFSDLNYFFAPADGVILYQEEVKPDETMVRIKGHPYTLRDAMRDPSFDRPSLVIGVFMTFYDVHVNRVPYPGTLSYKPLERLDTYNHPMLDVEKSILEDLRLVVDGAHYLHQNQRVLNRVHSPALGGDYYVLQVADYDVDCITPFSLKPRTPYSQGQRFSQIRFGSQVDLIIPLARGRDLTPTRRVTDHVEAGVDTLVAVTSSSPTLSPDPEVSS